MKIGDYFIHGLVANALNAIWWRRGRERKYASGATQSVSFQGGSQRFAVG